MKSFSQELRRLPEFVRWRRPFLLLLLIVREIGRPFMYWFVYDVFETDLRLPIPEPYSHEQVTVRVYEANNVPARVLEDLTAMDGLCPADLQLRLGRGDAVAIAYAGDRAVGCMWLSFSTGIELGFGTSWVVRPGEALRYGAFVRPEWRGRAVHSLLNSVVNRCARERGVLRTLGGVSMLNSQSRSLARHYRKLRSMRVILFKVRGLKWVYRKSIGAPLESRFSVLPDPHTRHPRTAFAKGQRLRKIISPVAHLFPSHAYRRKQGRTRL